MVNGIYKSEMKNFDGVYLIVDKTGWWKFYDSALSVLRKEGVNSHRQSHIYKQAKTYPDLKLLLPIEMFQ